MLSLVRADLPGLTDEDIDVHLDGQSLTIRADRAEVAMDRGHSVLLGTRARFERRLALPDGIDTVRASAEMRDGVVTVTMPKVASRLRETGGAFKERMRSLWSRLRGRGATRQS